MYGNDKKLLFVACAAAAGLALSRRSLAKPAAAKAGTPRAGNEAGAAYQEIDAYIEAQMRRLKLPGVSLAIVEGEQITHLKGYGHARPEGEAPSECTPFVIGSLTKSITALGVMQLVEAGKVELDAPVQRYLPWFHVANPQVSAQMTIRHLLNQTSGLPLLPSEVAFGDYDDLSDAIERQARDLSTLKVTRPAGEKCEYSNFNYNLLGLVIEAASGEAYAGYIQKHIFDPLEMRHTYTSRAEARHNGLAVGHRHWFSLPFPAPDMPEARGSLPSGQLISSAEDMAHYLIAHLNGGRYRNVEILSGAGIDELHRGAVDFEMFGITMGKYGMGWFDTNLGQTKTYSHGGNVPDFSAFMALLPEKKSGVVILLNADPYGLPVILEEVGMGVTALLDGQQPAPIRLDFIQWIMRCLPLIPLLQAAGACATLRQLSRWRREPALRPGGGRLWGKQILLPLIPNLALADALAYLRSSRLLVFFQLFIPDLAWIARISGGFAGVWSGLRTILTLRAIQK